MEPRRWTKSELAFLVMERQKGVQYKFIGRALKRDARACQRKLHKMGMSPKSIPKHYSRCRINVALPEDIVDVAKERAFALGMSLALYILKLVEADAEDANGETQAAREVRRFSR